MANAAAALVVLLVVLLGVALLSVSGGGAASSAQHAYNESHAAWLASLQRSHSHYYALPAPRDHRTYVGGAWAEIGALELAYMRSNGLSTSHLLLDLGCGALRGGVHFVRYLDAGHYYGLDLNPHLIDAGYERELAPLGLKPKLPRSNLAAVSDFDSSRFGRRFDFVVCVSVWTHLPLAAVEASMRKVAGVLAPGGRFYATYFACPEGAPLGRQIVQFASGAERIVTHADKDWFHHKASALRQAARRSGLRMRDVGAWGHPRGQLMLEHLAQIYFEHVAPRRAAPTYYNLLHHLAEDRSDELAWRALKRVRQAIERQFGPHFELINDFYSYRSARQRIFPNWHQDIEFWLTGKACDGFNLWILLEHERMNYSFDVYDVSSNRPFYDALYAQRFGAAGANYSTEKPLFSPAEYQRRSPGKGGLVTGRLPGMTGAAAPAFGVVPLEVGDALVVRQVEIHRTDMHPLDERQWRLAIGFKVIRRDVPLVKPTRADSPFGYDYEQCRRRYPGLVPPLEVGRTVPSAYNRTALASLRLYDASYSPASLLLALASTSPVLLVPAVGVAMLLAARVQQRSR